MSALIWPTTAVRFSSLANPLATSVLGDSEIQASQDFGGALRSRRDAQALTDEAVPAKRRIVRKTRKVVP
jgi:hypothetical protein